ncbi:MAG: hypothetical protein IJ716_08290 [Lachnospiraceae bacterium]|nr:hypothetical protein [Lachnospiraceae bacterium]MBR1852681.1 hypothetical protein [Lachnospiraceae bacterium]
MSAIDVSEALLEEAKNFLDITWEDEDTDKKLKGQLRRGIAYITGKTGVAETSFESASEDVNYRAQELLFNYLLYDRAGAIDQFKKNYSSDILSLRMKWEVENAAKSDS